MKQRLQTLNTLYEKKIISSDTTQRKIESTSLLPMKQDAIISQTTIQSLKHTLRSKLDKILHLQSLRDLKLAERDLVKDKCTTLR